MSGFSRFKKKKAPAGPTQKPIRIEKKMVHGQLVEVKIYATLGVTSGDADVRPRPGQARCSG